MKNFRNIGLSLLACSFIALPAMADQTSELRQGPLFSQFDQNSDGSVSNVELSNVFLGNIPADVFASYDLNKNGTLNQTEFSKFMNNNYQTFLANKQEASQVRIRNEAAQEMVAAKNAMIKERNAAAKTINQNQNKVILTLDFRVYDKNTDGYVDRNEFEAQTNTVDLDEIYGSYDNNHDGKLSISEFKRFVNSDPLIPVDYTKTKIGY